MQKERRRFAFDANMARVFGMTGATARNAAKKYKTLTEAIEVLEPMAASQTIDDDELQHFCGECGHELQLVRPGKYQCNQCEAKAQP